MKFEFFQNQIFLIIKKLIIIIFNCRLPNFQINFSTTIIVCIIFHIFTFLRQNRCHLKYFSVKTCTDSIINVIHQKNDEQKFWLKKFHTYPVNISLDLLRLNSTVDMRTKVYRNMLFNKYMENTFSLMLKFF